MTNTKAIKKKLIDLDITQVECSSKMGMALSTFNFKLNGKSDWTVAEIEKLSKILKIPRGKYTEYFFCTKGCQCVNQED